MKGWLVAAEALEKAHPGHKGPNFELHTGASFTLRDMVHAYFSNNHITSSDPVLGDEYQHMIRVFPQPKKQLPQR